MLHRLSTVLATIYDQAKAAIIQTRRGRDLIGGQYKLAHEVSIAWAQGCETVNVTTGNEKQVGGGNRVDILKD